MMSAPTKTIKPMCDAVTAIESSVAEHQIGQIIVPMEYGKDSKIRRGVVISVGPSHCEAWEVLEPGTVIYYNEALEIADVVVVHHDWIVAYEGVAD